MLNNKRISLKHTRLNLDILPQRYRGRHFSFSHLLFLLCVIAGATVLAVLYIVATDAMYHTSILREQADILDTRMQIKTMLLNEQAKMAAVVDDFDAINNRRDAVYQDVVAVENAAGQIGIDIEYIRCEGNTIIVNCSSKQYETYDDYRDTFESYYQALSETGRFVSVKRPPTDWSPSTASVRIEISH